MSMTHRLRSLLPSTRKHVLGLDIGTDGARLAMVHRSGDHYAVDWVEEISLTDYQGFADYDAVIEKLEAVVRERVRGRVDVATVPPWSSARIGIEEMPVMTPERFEKAAEWYFARTHNDDMANPVHHAVPQKPRQTPEGQEVLDGVMISMDEIMLDGLGMLCRRLELRLRWLLPPPLCHAPLLRLGGKTQSRHLLLDIGAGQTRMTLLVDGHVRLVRKLKPCANDVLRHVSEDAGISWEQAGQALQAHSGIGPLSESDPEGIAERAHEAIEKSLDKVISRLQEETERSRAYIQARHGEDVDLVLLTGGLGGSPYLLAKLREGLTGEVESLDPFRAVELSAEIPEAARCHYALAVGAAIQVFEGDEVHNILRSVPRASMRPPKRVKLPTLNAKRVVPAAIVAGAVLGLGAYDLRSSLRVSSLQNDIEVLQTRHDVLRETADGLANQANLFDLEDRIESLRDIYNSRQLHTPFFTRVVGCLPEGLWLDALSVARDGDSEPEPHDPDPDDPDAYEAPAETLPPLRVHLEGRSDKVDAIGALVLALETEGLLSSIRVLDIREAVEEESEAERTEGFRFEIQGTPIVGRQDEDLALRPREAR